MHARPYMVQKVLDGAITSAKVDILARYAGFFQSVRKCPFHEVLVMSGLVSRDIRTTTGGNTCPLEELSGLDPCVF